MILRGVKPERSAMPITSAATARTVALYRWMLTSKQHNRYALGISDMLRGMPNGVPTAYPSPTLYETPQVFFDQTGRWPGFYSAEYHDPAWSNRYGQQGTDAIRAAIIQAAERGAIISLHNHPGNPVTGAMSRNGLSWSDAQTGTGNYGDRNGSPLAAIKTGGAQEAQFLAFLDRLATFINSLVDSRGTKIPVVLRMFHELGNGTWFWWNGADRAADMVLVWQKMVNYLRNTKGLTNVLFCWNVNAQASDNFFPWWPGRDYVDILSIDQYDLRDSTDINLDGASNWVQPCWAFIAAYAKTANKPLAFAELGYQFTNTRGGSDLWTTKTGDKITGKYPESCLACLWPSPYGPGATDPQALKNSLKAWAESPNALTAGMMPDVAPVIPSVAPVNTRAPALAPTSPVVDSPIVFDLGDWTNATGFTWQLRKGSTVVAQNPALNYTPVTDDEGAQFTLYVVATRNALSTPMQSATTAATAPKPVTIVDPTIAQHPSSQTVTEGNAMTMTVVATNGGGTLQYRWNTRPNSGGTASIVPGATSSTLVRNATALSDSGFQYQAEVRNETGVWVPSNWATLTVEAGAVVAVMTPDPADGSTGNLTTFPHARMGAGPNADKFMIGSIKQNFQQSVRLYTHDTGAFLSEQVVRTHNERNDHCDPAIAAYPDGSFMVAACGHSTNLNIEIWYRAVDGTWTSETLVATGASVTYPNLHLDNANTAWLFIRVNNYQWGCFTKVQGQPWSAQQNFCTMGSGQLYCTPFRHDPTTNRIRFWARPNSAESSFGATRMLELDCTTKEFFDANGACGKIGEASANGKTLPIVYSTIPEFIARPSGFQLNVHDSHKDVIWLTKREDGNQANTEVHILTYKGTGSKLLAANWDGYGTPVFNQNGVMSTTSNLTSGGCVAREPLPAGNLRIYGSRRESVNGVFVWRQCRYDKIGSAAWVETINLQSSQFVGRACAIEGARANTPVLVSRMSQFTDYNIYAGAGYDYVRPTDGAIATAFQDTFTEAAQTALSAHAPNSGGSWVQNSGYTGVLSVDPSGRTSAAADAVYTLAADVFNSRNVWAEFGVIYSTNAGNSIRLGVFAEAAGFDGYFLAMTNSANGGFFLQERNAGALNVLATVTKVGLFVTGDNIGLSVKPIDGGAVKMTLWGNSVPVTVSVATPKTGKKLALSMTTTGVNTGVGHDQAYVTTRA